MVPWRRKQHLTFLVLGGVNKFQTDVLPWSNGSSGFASSSLTEQTLPGRAGSSRCSRQLQGGPHVPPGIDTSSLHRDSHTHGSRAALSSERQAHTSRGRSFFTCRPQLSPWKSGTLTGPKQNSRVPPLPHPQTCSPHVPVFPILGVVSPSCQVHRIFLILPSPPHPQPTSRPSISCLKRGRNSNPTPGSRPLASHSNKHN